MQLIYQGDNQIGITNIRYLPRWIVIAIDLFILVISILLTFFILQNLTIRPYSTLSLF